MRNFMHLVCPLNFSNLYYFLTLCHPNSGAFVGQDLLWQFIPTTWIYITWPGFISFTIFKHVDSNSNILLNPRPHPVMVLGKII